jgi:hypothetical protein
MSFESDLIWVHAAINVQYAFNLLSYLNIYMHACAHMHAYAHPHPHFHDPLQTHAGHIHPYLSTYFIVKKK